MNKDNTLVLFKNDKKETDKHPDLQGQGVVDGKEYWIAGWKNVSQEGTGYIKISLDLKDSIKEPNAKQKDAGLDLPF